MQQSTSAHNPLPGEGRALLQNNPQGANLEALLQQSPSAHNPLPGEAELFCRTPLRQSGGHLEPYLQQTTSANNPEPIRGQATAELFCRTPLTHQGDNLEALLQQSTSAHNPLPGNSKPFLQNTPDPSGGQPGSVVAASHLCTQPFARRQQNVSAEHP